MQLALRDVVRGFFDPSPCFVCSNLEDPKSNARYRVPLVNVQPTACMMEHDPVAGAAALASLPTIPSTEQLKAIVGAGHGLGLWAPKRVSDESSDSELDQRELQHAAGSLVVFPPAEWELLRSEFVDWQSDGVEAAFQGLPYGFDDILIFAGPNFSANRWFLVLRGPMAGNVYWWTHDGESAMRKPWAKDIRAWADRLFADKPEDLLDGLVRFTARASLDPASPDAELYPLEYLPTVPDRV